MENLPYWSLLAIGLLDTVILVVILFRQFTQNSELNQTVKTNTLALKDIASLRSYLEGLTNSMARNTESLLSLIHI